MMKTIDLNCDVGEGMNNEADLMPLISSCNIACGRHAGDEKTMLNTVELALHHGVSIGAHPSYDDRENFGRREYVLSKAEIKNLVAKQIELLSEICLNHGAKIRHVKPHGALYNQAARSHNISVAIIEGVLSVNPDLKLYGLAGSQMERASRDRIPFVAEGFADRRYLSRTELESRSKDGLMTNKRDIFSHLSQLLGKGRVQTIEGAEDLDIQTLCLHGDTPDALKIMKGIQEIVHELGFKIQAP